MAYTLLDLQTAVQDDLKDTSFSSARITRYLNYGQRVIFNRQFFRFTEKLYTGTISANATSVAQQADHQSTIDGLLYDPNSTARQFVLDETTYMPSREFFTQNPTPDLQEAGSPSWWTEYGTTIYFDRPLDVTYNFRQRYYYWPPDMSSQNDVPTVPEPFRELLEMYADYRSEKYRGNHDIAGTYLQAFEDGLEDMTLRYSEPTSIGPTVMGSNRTRVDES